MVNKLKLHSQTATAPILKRHGYPARIKTLDPNLLVNQLDAFRNGYLRDAVLTWETMEERDDTVRIASAKRKKAVTRRGYEILTLQNSAAALRHKEALEYFYDNLVATNAFDENEQGGFKLLAHQMMDAIGKRYAVHEIVWKPQNDGKLTAEFRFVPLWCFENTTGSLRFMPQEYSNRTIPLEKGGWLISVGDGIMAACSVACLYRQLPLRDWLTCCNTHGMPGLLGTTSAERGSDEWSDMVKTMESFLEDSAALLGQNETLEVIKRAQADVIPFPGLVEEMTRAILTLWRGGDLSTRSIRYGTGASMQQDEAALLEADDAEWISETLHVQVDHWVIRHLFGKDVKPLATIHLRNSQKSDVDMDLKVDEFLLRHQVPLSMNQLLERYQRSTPSADEQVVKNEEMKQFGAV